MDRKLKPSSFSSTSSISDEDFYNISKGEYTKFDSFDNDIECICSNVCDDYFGTESYYSYENFDSIYLDSERNIDHFEKCIENSDSTIDKFNVTTSSDTDTSKSTSPVFISVHDEDLKHYQQSCSVKIEKSTSFRKRLQSTFTKRASFLYKINTDKYNLIFQKKQKSFSRTTSVPKIIVVSPTSPKYIDSGNDSDSDNDVHIFQKEKQVLETCSAGQKSYLKSKRKFLRKSI